MSSPTGDWSDRRGLAHKGKELHEPTNPTGRKFGETGSVSNAVRRASASSQGGDDKGQAGQFPTASGGRRRSSAASGGLFGSLQNMKRGSEDYGERRANHQEMMGGGGGIVSGWFNSTFKGHGLQNQNQNQKQGEGSPK